MTALWRWGKRAKRGADTAGIDCAGVMEQLYEYIDEELDDDALVEKIRAHLELCQDCFPRYRFEKTFLRFLSEQGRNSAPHELRHKIFQRLLEEESRD